MHPEYTPRDVARFWSKVDRTGRCWLWTAGTGKRGYGRFKSGGVDLYAHRFSYILAHGAIPHGIFVCHNCPDGDNPLCVNPAHLWLGTPAANVEDMMRKGRHRVVPLFGERNGYVLHPERYPRGVQRPDAKLTEAQVIEIRRLAATGSTTRAELARSFGVTWCMINLIVSGQKWRHLLASSE